MVQILSKIKIPTLNPRLSFSQAGGSQASPRGCPMLSGAGNTPITPWPLHHIAAAAGLGPGCRKRGGRLGVGGAASGNAPLILTKFASHAFLMAPAQWPVFCPPADYA